MSIKTTNPATNKVLKSFDEMTDKQVEAITISNSTYMNGRKRPNKDRASHCIE
jgi:succinate-semialdehyde dehydrogenase/glutarate-semialdehyde dehydrogenase